MMLKLKMPKTKKKDKRKDAVLIHGMFSCALALRPFARALEKRNIYRRIIVEEISSWKHRGIPRLYGRENAEKLAERLQLKIANRSLGSDLDVIGHSNGGYIALFLPEFLTTAKVDYTFTISSPRGMPPLSDFDLPASRRKKIVHFRGGVDITPFGYRHNPGDGEVVITFPDEGHSSLHFSAENNGLADIISWANNKQPDHLFTDQSTNVIHPWAFCRDDLRHKELTCSPFRASLDWVVCNGMHDSKLESLKQEKEMWNVVLRFAGTDPKKHLAHALGRLSRYFRLRRHLIRTLERIKNDSSLARLHGNELKVEMLSLQQQNIALQERLLKLDDRISTFFAAACHKHRLQLDAAIRPLNAARHLCASLEKIDEEALNGIADFLRESADEFADYFQDNSTGLPRPDVAQ